MLLPRGPFHICRTAGDLVASCLTPQHVGDTGALPGLLAEVSGSVRRFIGDGAYDGGKAPAKTSVPLAL